MSHYDCSNCGASMGISYGYCSDCTPKEVLDAEAALVQAESLAANKWDNDHFKERCEYIVKRTKALHKKYVKLYEEGKG